jgi:hypothetical protein
MHASSLLEQGVLVVCFIAKPLWATMRVKNRTAVIFYFWLESLALLTGIVLLAVTFGAKACTTPFVSRYTFFL